jgi:hypothetical protein
MGGVWRRRGWVGERGKEEWGGGGKVGREIGWWVN